MEILVVISFFIYIVYNLISLYTLGIPHSLSNTYYLWNGVKQGAGYAFCVCLGLMVALLLPSWLEMSGGSPWQFLSFLTCGSLLFVAAAPNFKSIGIESTIHTVAAICAAVFGMLWTIFIVKCRWIVLLVGLLILGYSLQTKTLRKCYVYWLETIAFLSIYFSIFFTYFIN